MHIIAVANDDDVGAFITDFGKLFQLMQQFLTDQRGFDEDQVRGRHRLIVGDGCTDTAHIDLHVGLRYTAVL